MVSLGIGMAPREFDCLICQRHFTRFCADMILPEYSICDQCLAELRPLEGDELRRRVSQRLAESGSQRGKGFEDEIVRAIQRVQQL